MTPALSSARIPIRKEPIIRDLADLAITMDRQMPQSPDAERAILGAVLVNNNAFWRVSQILKEREREFFRDAHRTIYTVMDWMARNNFDIEPLTVKEELVKRGKLEQVGGVAYVTSLMDVVPDVANVERYAEIVHRLFKKREQIILGSRLIQDGFDLEIEPEDSAAMAIPKLSNIATAESSQARPLVEVLTEAANAMMTLRDSNQSLALTSGWAFLDEHQVFSPVFSVCGGNTKTGKTALMVNFAEALASRDQPVAVISLESSVRALALRYLSIRTSIPHTKMRDWRWLSDRQNASIDDIRRESANRGIYVGFGPVTVEEILLELRRLRAVHGIKAAFIDYLQNVELKKHIENREERFHKISKMLQLAAPELDIHIMGMSQLRDGAGAEGRITMGDIAYAKSIGKSARVALFFKRDGCKVSGQLEANNEGRTNDFHAHFQEETQQFEEGAMDGRAFWPCVETSEGIIHRRPSIHEEQRSLI